jgi:hypothetical protein
MFTKNIGKSERVLRFIIGLILLIIGYQVAGISRFLAYFVGALMLLTSLLGWCFLYGLLGFSSRGKGMNKIAQSEIERVVRENRITPMKVSVAKVGGQEKKVVKAAPKKKAVSKKKTTVKKKGKIGRPVKNKVDKLSKKVTVNLTEAEFEKLKKLSEKNFDVPIPKLIRSFLKQGNHI